VSKRRRFWGLALLGAFVLVFLSAESVRIAVRVALNRNDAAIALPDRPAPKDQAEANRQDVADLSGLPDIDRSFSPPARIAFDQGVKQLAGTVDAMSPAELEMAVSRLVALAGNGHTTVDLSQRAARFGMVPLRFAWFIDGLYVVQAKSAYQDVLGGRVTAIDGRPIEEALRAVRPFISGNDSRARIDSTTVLESPRLLQTIWPEADPDRITIGLTLQNGQSIRTIAALPPARDPLAGLPLMAIAPTADESGWKTVLPPKERPLSLRKPERVAYSEPLDDDGVYIRINANSDDRYGRLADQLAAILVAAPKAGWRWIALDLRFNDGGDEMKTAAFTRALPKALRRDGQVFILTGNATFSAAIIIAARVKYFVGSRAHIVGEAVGDHDRFWTSGGAPLVLRNSGIAISHAYFLHDWVHGCRSLRNCYPGNFIYGIAAGDLSPEVSVGWRFSDYAAGRDTVMNRVRALAGTESRH
jgi:hypothetical protein